MFDVLATLAQWVVAAIFLLMFVPLYLSVVAALIARAVTEAICRGCDAGRRERRNP